MATNIEPLRNFVFTCIFTGNWLKTVPFSLNPLIVLCVSTKNVTTTKLLRRMYRFHITASLCSWCVCVSRGWFCLGILPCDKISLTQLNFHLFNREREWERGREIDWIWCVKLKMEWTRIKISLKHRFIWFENGCARIWMLHKIHAKNHIKGIKLKITFDWSLEHVPCQMLTLRIWSFNLIELKANNWITSIEHMVQLRKLFSEHLAVGFDSPISLSLFLYLSISLSPSSIRFNCDIFKQCHSCDFGI